MKKSSKPKSYKLAIILLLLVAMVVNLTSCYSVDAADLMDGFSSNVVKIKSTDDTFVKSTADFSVELFKKTITDSKNSLISPLSVLLALSMTANGADKETLSQMENVLGKDISLGDLNEYIYTYVKNLPSDNKSRLTIANSIWFRDNLKVKKNFLQKNADYYNAAAYKSPFDGQTLVDINDWVNKNTAGMIDKIIDEISDDAVMYLINAIVFDAEWQDMYEKNNITKGGFTAIDGSKKTVDFMNSKESIYLDDGKATGFIKPYANDEYSFVALLPNENVPIGDYIGTLSGEGFLNTISQAQNIDVLATLPKFSYDYSVNMNDALINLGMTDAFSADNADFSKLAESKPGNIYIGEVLHKTFISVDERGTKAGAVTAIEVKATGMPMEQKIVRLDRPFVYAIIDNATNLPVFLGTVMSVN